MFRQFFKSSVRIGCTKKTSNKTRLLLKQVKTKDLRGFWIKGEIFSVASVAHLPMMQWGELQLWQECHWASCEELQTQTLTVMLRYVLAPTVKNKQAGTKHMQTQQTSSCWIVSHSFTAVLRFVRPYFFRSNLLNGYKIDKWSLNFPFSLVNKYQYSFFHSSSYLPLSLCNIATGKGVR